jgi:hypothetical protein
VLGTGRTSLVCKEARETPLCGVGASHLARISQRELYWLAGSEERTACSRADLFRESHLITTLHAHFGDSASYLLLTADEVS